MRVNRSGLALVTVTAAFAVGLTCIGPACSLGTLDDLTGATDGGGKLDGSRDDAAALDAPDQDARWCSHVQALFCDDFDFEASAPPWDRPILHLVSFTVDGTQSRSPPNALSATSEPTDGGAGVLGFYAKHFARPIAESHFAFDIYIQRVDPTVADAELARIELTTGYVLILKYTTPGGMQMVEALPPQTADGGFTYTGRKLARSVLVGEWTHVQIDTFAATGAAAIGTFTVEIGEADAQANALAAPAGRGASGEPTIEVGVATYDQPSSSWRVYYDNVTFDMK